MKLFKKAKENKKGFTLVELIVVLVILAILIALLVPALTGYIDKARQKTIQAEARYALTAIQTEATDHYGNNGCTISQDSGALSDSTSKMLKDDNLVDGYTLENITSVAIDINGVVKNLTYENDRYTATYKAGPNGTGGEWNTTKKATAK